MPEYEKKTDKERVAEITDKLENGIKDLVNGDNFKKYLATMSKFHNYSFNNTMLIAMQKPDASLVAGFNTWKNKFERNVNRGEKGILLSNEDTGFVSKIIGGFMLGAAIHGIVHSEFLLKNIMKALKKYSIIGLFIGLGLCCMLICLFSYIGGIFLVVDTVLFILKKPLIYPFENKSFLKSKAVQEELYQQNLDNSYVAGSIQKLNEMMKQGLITEEEFNSKKAELLERI